MTTYFHHSMVGGGLIIGGLFFPPLLLPAFIVGGVGAGSSLIATVVELAVPHKKRLKKITLDLIESRLIVDCGSTK